jgi:hypothetical protein
MKWPTEITRRQFIIGLAGTFERRLFVAMDNGVEFLTVTTDAVQRGFCRFEGRYLTASNFLGRFRQGKARDIVGAHFGVTLSAIFSNILV